MKKKEEVMFVSLSKNRKTNIFCLISFKLIFTLKKKQYIYIYIYIAFISVLFPIFFRY
jgi:hypothetical protein